MPEYSFREPTHNSLAEAALGPNQKESSHDPIVPYLSLGKSLALRMAAEILEI